MKSHLLAQLPLHAAKNNNWPVIAAAAAQIKHNLCAPEKFVLEKSVTRCRPKKNHTKHVVFIMIMIFGIIILHY